MHNDWEVLKECNLYEINKNFPHYIRRIGTTKPLVCTMYGGYINVEIFKRLIPLHRLIATQWIDNPYNYKVVDHIDGDKTNWHIDNLRWTNHKENARNRHTSKNVKLNLVEDIPSSCKPLDIYEGKRINNLYVDMKTYDIYKYNSILFELLNKQ